MSLMKLSRQAGWVILFVFILPVVVCAQSLDNHIEIVLLSESYDCTTGKASVSFHITNYDPDGVYGFYHTIYSIDLGASRVVGRSIASGDGDVSFTGNYHPGDEIVCTAWGISNNGAPEVQFRFVATVPPPPNAPSISSSASMPLCNGTSAILSANGSRGNYTWSNGETGSSISVTGAGPYTVHETGLCGVSAESSPFVVSTGATPAAPVIGSSNGTLLCNGQSTLFTATSSGGTVNWNNGASGTSFSTSSAGIYYASETNGCGTSGNSNVITITTGSSPSAPSVSSSNGESLCNGQSTLLSATPTAGGSISWNTGATGNSINVSSPGSYYSYESNSCGTSGYSNVINITTGSAPSTPSINSSNGVLLCNGNSTILSASGTGSISWNTGASGNSISVSSGGVYYAYASNNCGTSGNSNSINIGTGVSPSVPSVSSSNGILLCNGSSSVLSASPSYGGTIHWNTGAVGNNLSVSSAGDYYAYEVNGCATGSSSNIISIATASTPASPSVTPSGNQLLCNGANVTLSSSGANVLWSNGASGNTITVSTAGNYFTYDRNVCGNSGNSNSVTVSTVVCPTPVPGSSFFVCPGTLKTLDAGAGYDTYEWSNGASTRFISVGPGAYTVTVSKSGCYASSAAVTVGYFTVATPTITASGATTFCVGGSVGLSASSGSAYSWSNGTNSSSITVGTAGAYYVTVIDGNGCQAVSAAVNVSVNPLPSASISGSATVCQNSSAPSVVFSGSGGTAPYSFVYKINGGAAQTISTVSGNSVSISVPTASAGNYTYTLVSVSESSSTVCSNSASGSATVAVNALPSATISGNATVCRNSASPLITFTGSGETAPYTFTYRINGGSNQFVTTTSGNSVSVSVPTSVAGTAVYSLVSVQEASANACVNNASGTATVTVNPLPNASITGGATVCQGSPSPIVVFTGSGGVAPYTFTYQVNNGSSQTITTVSGNSISLPAATTAQGNYTFTLVSVQESSSVACSNSASGSVTVAVHALPSATISGSVSVCRNASSPAIVFTGNGGVAPYTFSYRINGGNLQTITTVSGNTASVQVPTDAAGSFVYTLVSVQESSSTACANGATESATITINPLPTASISGNTTVCQNGPNPSVLFTGSGGAAPYTFTYRINSGANQVVSTSSGNSVNVSASSAIAGNYTYSLVSVQDASSTACSNAASGNVIITVNPQPVKSIVSSNNTHLCNGETGVIKVVNFISGNSYTWYKDGIVFRITSGDTIHVTVAGNYTVLPISSEGCAAAIISDPVSITTGSVVTPVITGSVKVCPDGKTLLTAIADDGRVYDQWRWTGPPGRRLLSEDSSFSAVAGQYRVWVSAQGCADSATVAITADDTEFPAGKLTIDHSAIGYGDQVILEADVNGAVNYRWDLGNGRIFQTRSNKVVENYYVPGDSIPVKVWATSQRNCTSLFTGSVKVGAMQEKTLTDHSWTGGVKDWNVFPLPFHDVLNITAVLKRNETIKIDLFTADAKWMRSWSMPGRKGENVFAIDNLSDLLPNVIYFISAIYNGEKHFDKIYKY